MRMLIVAALLTSVVIPNSSAAEAGNQLPSEQQVLMFIASTIDWYRQLPTSQRIGSDPTDLFFVEDNRPTAMEIVRLSFQFGKAVAAIGSPEHMPGRAATGPGAAADRELPYLLSVKTKLDASAQRSSDQLKVLTEARLTARAAERTRLDTQITEMRTRIQLLNTITANYQNLADFVRTASAASNTDGRLSALVEDLERTVPEVSGSVGATRLSNPPADPQREGYGIMGRISRISALARKEHSIATAIERTNALMVSLQNVRSPFREAFVNQLATFSSDEENLNALQQQESLLERMVAQLQTVSPAVAALIKQETLLNIYRTRLTEWQSEVEREYGSAWRALVIRLGALAAGIAVLFGIHAIVRHILTSHVKDRETRQALLAGERVVFWLLIVALVLFSFAFDPSALATFFGLLTAGLAVGLHDVLLAIGGRMLLARRFHLRVGERIEIAGVKGEVTELGLMEFSLNEIDAEDRTTGREVHFANSYVFVSPATPLFRQTGA